MRGLVLIFFLLSVSAACMAQKGTAEPGYYPMSYAGETWTGEVTAVNEDIRELTLSYTSNNKTQTFVGVLAKGYTVKMKDGRDHEIKVSELMGMTIRAYYMTKSKKDPNGVKVKTNEVFRIKFVTK